MKKITLSVLLVISTISTYFSQANLIIQAPLSNNSTTQQRAPNGLASSAYMRACALVLQSELSGLQNGSTLNSFGFTLTTGTSGVPVAGNFTVYLQNTADLTYLKGTNFATAITGMTSVFANVMTIPLSAGTTSILLTLSTPFVYTGGGLYVAYDWISTGPFSATPATYLSENAALIPGCASAASAASSPTLLTTTNFRPSFLFGTVNTYTNEIQVTGIDANGKVSVLYNAAQNIKATIYNSSNIPKSNITVTLNAVGANPVSNVQSIAVLAAGAFTTVTFAPFTATNVGLSTLSVSVAADENNNNNSYTYAQKVTCNEFAKNPAIGNYTANAVGFGVGSGILGNTFINPANATLVGMNFAVSTNTASVGGQIYGVLMNPAGAILAVTNTVIITPAMLGTFQEFTFFSQQTLFASTPYILGMAQMTGTVAYYPAGTMSSNYVTPMIYSSASILGGALTPITQNFGYFGLEAVFSHSFNVLVSGTPTVLCIGNTASIVATGPVTNYTWSNGANTSSITVSPTLATSYSVVATNSIGCVSKGSFNLYISPLPNVTISGSPSVCAGSTLALYAGGATTYSWSTGALTASIVETPTATTSYSVIGTTLYGCVGSTVVSINVETPNYSVSSNTSVCIGNSVTLTATGLGTYNYIWSNGSPFSSTAVSPSVTTIYSVTATDQNACTNTQTVSVTANPTPTVTATAPTTVICKNDALSLTASGASTYVWNTSATGSLVVITPTANGTWEYTVTGTSSNGCSSTASISVKVSACLALNEAALSDLQVQIFPNPVESYLHLNLNNLTGNVDFELYDVLGKLVCKKTLQDQNNTIPVYELPLGIYTIKLQHGSELIYTNKFIKN